MIFVYVAASNTMLTKCVALRQLCSSVCQFACINILCFCMWCMFAENKINNYSVCCKKKSAIALFVKSNKCLQVLNQVSLTKSASSPYINSDVDWAMESIE